MRHTTLPAIFFAGIATLCIAVKSAADEPVAVQSPNGQLQIRLQVAESGGALLSIDSQGRPVIETSTLDVRLADLGSISAGATIQDVTTSGVDETIDLPWGKTSRMRNHYQAALVRLRSGGGVEWEVQMRAYDDGAAFRYGIPVQERLRDFVIEQEATEFRLPGNPLVMYMPLEGFTTSHEALYERKPLSEVPADRLLEMPVLATWPDGRAAAITEASLRGFAGMYLERPADSSGNVLRSRLSPLPGSGTTRLADAAVAAKTPHWTPWRVVLVADEAGRLIESNLMLCLNEPPDGDFSWLKPGKTTFHWWNGTVEHGPPSTPETNFELHKKYIDFCARNKIRYHSVISVEGNRPWFVQREAGFHDLPHKDTDILTARPDIDLPRILAYAKEKGVEIRFWVHWKPLSEKLDEAFAQYEKWGIRGLMVDFMDRDDQEMVEWQERCLRSAARHKLHIQFHGSYKPTGEQRTFPNLVNREGVLNLEYLKWSDLCTPPHAVNVAYTRALGGPVDFHLGGFRAVPRKEFQPRDLMPLVIGTRCHHLALYLVYENPMPMVADDPEAYEGQPGFDFIVEVPTTWDETRFVAGEAGEYIVIARRSGDAWYLGGITNWTARELKLPLDFLGKGTFDAKLYLDGALDGAEPNKIRLDERQVTANETIAVSLASGGGIAGIIRPQ